MFRWGLWVLALGGCAQLAGIDNTSKGVDATPPAMSQLQLEHVSIGKTVAKGPQDVTMLQASFLVPDAASPGGLRAVAPTTSGLDTWIADTGGTTVPVQYQSPELPATTLRILDLPVPVRKMTVTVLEHPLAEPPPMGATITVNLGLNTAQAGQTYQLFTIGAWASIALTAPAAGAGTLAPGAVTLTAANTPGGRLDRITPGDVVTVLRYTGNQLVSHFVAPPIDQTMAATSITGSMVATPLTETLDIRVDQQAAAARLSTVRPAVGAPTYVWRVRASPGLDYFVENGPQLHAASVAAPTTPDPQTITAMYGNPFADFKSLVTWDIRATRTYTGPTMLTVSLAAGMTERAEPAAALALKTPAGLPDRITANGILLNVDNATVAAPMEAPVDVSFVTDAPANTAYNVELLELVPSGMTYTLTRVVTVTSTMPNVKIPRDLFKPATLYVLRAFSLVGCYPAIATGDLSQRTLPCTFTFADSGVFQVTP